VARLVPYSPGKPADEVKRELGLTHIVKLASNENALGPSPLAIAAIHEAAAHMHIYPDAGAHLLRQALSASLDVDPACLAFGNGSDDLIHLLGITFLEPGDEVIQADPSFVRYLAAAQLNDSYCHLVSLDDRWTHDLDAMAERINERTRLIFITNPNNPTGTIVGRRALDRFLDRIPDRAIVVLDEAYYEYAAYDPDYPDVLPYIREGRNLVALRTFSKAYGLAGLRIGYGIAREEIIGFIDRTREPFNVNHMAQLAAVAALGDTDHITRSAENNQAGIRQIGAALDRLGLQWTPTHANFIWFDSGHDNKKVFHALLKRGVIARAIECPAAPTHVRVTIGTPEENETFINALTEVLQSEEIAE
jgi:histidinol-phosphate aminotransferase